MSVVLVDSLEVVEVDADDRQAPPVAAGPGQLGGQRLVEAAVVGQSREGIGPGEPREARVLEIDQHQ
jgi:hypothetical protein